MSPLNVLLSYALLDLTRDCEREGAEEVVLWSNLFRVIGDDGTDVRDLPTLVRLSRRAVKTTTDALERSEWASRVGGVVRLTDVAQQACLEWGAAIVQAETGWKGQSLRRPIEPAIGFRAPLDGVNASKCRCRGLTETLSRGLQLGNQRHEAIIEHRQRASNFTEHLCTELGSSHEQ